MKYKKNYLSSVIVSLLAGFIYYYFALDFQKSVNDVFSFQKMEINVPDNSEDNLANFYSPLEDSELNNFFSKVKNNINRKNAFIESGITKAGLESRAIYQKPIPDKNVDFTAELNNLVNKKNSTSELNECKSLRDSYNEYADINSNRYLQRSIINKECFSASVNKDLKNGNGFEYNYVYQASVKSGNNSGGDVKFKLNNGTISVDVNDDEATTEIKEDYDEADESYSEDCDNSHIYKYSDSDTKVKYTNQWKVNVKSYNSNKNNNKNRVIIRNKNKNECSSDENEIFIEIQSLDDETL
ncbi:MAG: hypothetical protein WAT71_17600 [Ignavibacteria bacterium]